MRFRITSFAMMAVAAIVLGGAPTAQAAANITIGGSCKLSANWTVDVSANFDDTSGTPSSGHLRYIVMSSPGELAVGSTSDSIADVFFKPGYRLQSSRLGGFYFDRYVNGKYVYRVDLSPEAYATPATKVVVNPMSKGTRVRCNGYSSSPILLPRN